MYGSKQPSARQTGIPLTGVAVYQTFFAWWKSGYPCTYTILSSGRQALEALTLGTASADMQSSMRLAKGPCLRASHLLLGIRSLFRAWTPIQCISPATELCTHCMRRSKHYSPQYLHPHARSEGRLQATAGHQRKPCPVLALPQQPLTHALHPPGLGAAACFTHCTDLT